MTTYDWAEAARTAGIRDGRFNCGGVALSQERALVWVRANGSSVTLSGADLHHDARRLAAALADLGIRPGDRVAAVLGRRPESFSLPLAVWRVGAIYVPLFSGFAHEALRVRLVDSGAAMLVVDGPNAEDVQSVRSQLPNLRVIAVDDGPDPDHVEGSLVAGRGGAEETKLHDTSANDAATIMYTSGTTGPPKGCVIPHYGVVTLWPFVDHALALGEGSVLFSTADAGWSFGLYTTGIAPMSRGVTRVIYEGDFNASDWWRVAQETGSDHFASAPTGYRQLGAAGGEPLAANFPHSLRGGTSCGEPLTVEIVSWFEEHLGFTIHDSYGATELGILIAHLRSRPEESTVGSMGRQLPGFEVRLVSEDGRDVEAGEVGRVAVRDNGWLLSTDYWNRSSEWDERLQGDWWVTEDLARRDGEEYRYVGRSDDVIVTAGYNVGPGDVENVLLRHPLVLDAACVGEADARKGSVVAAHVVVSDGSEIDEELLLTELREMVGETLGWHAAPKRLHLRQSLPRTDSGKVRRSLLRTDRNYIQPE